VTAKREGFSIELNFLEIRERNCDWQMIAEMRSQGLLPLIFWRTVRAAWLR